MIYIIVPVACISVGLIGIGVWFFCIKRQKKDGMSNKETNSFSSLLVGHRQASTHDTGKFCLHTNDTILIIDDILFIQN